MKTIKTTLLVLFISILTVSCSKDDDNNNSSSASQDGIANITLTAGGQEFKINGPCGWASAGGTKYIGANQEGNSQRAFSSYFNISDLPTSTTTYTLVQDVLDENPLHITMNIAEITATNPATVTAWNSTDNSGTLTIVVAGNKYTVDLSGIVLTANQPSSGFINGNVGAFANNGILSGTLTFYKE